MNSITVNPPATPTVPMVAFASSRGLTASTTDCENIALSWNDPEDSAITGYQYSIDGGTTWKTIDGFDTSSLGTISATITVPRPTQYPVRAFKDGVTWNVQVQAVRQDPNRVVFTASANCPRTALNAIERDILIESNVRAFNNHPWFPREWAERMSLNVLRAIRIAGMIPMNASRHDWTTQTHPDKVTSMCATIWQEEPHRSICLVYYRPEVAKAEKEY